MAFAIALIYVPAEAATVSPMIVEVSPSGSHSIARIELSNPGEEDFPVEVMMFRGEISEAGELNLIPAEEDFLVFPAQIIVKPQGQQVFRIQYVGEPNLVSSQVYYAAIRQIPVDFVDGESQLQLVVNYNILINVVPNGAKSNPVVEIIGLETRNEIQGLQLRVVNTGAGFFLAGQQQWDVAGQTASGESFSRRFTAEEIAKSFGVGIVAPGKARVFFLPLNQPLVEGTITVTPT